MGHYYQDLDKGWYDYDLQTVEGLSGKLFRGPAVDLSRPYIACIGAAQTYGRFCDRPFPSILADRLDHQALNLGIGGAGPRLFDNENYLSILNKAECVIVQVLSARSASNSLFDNQQTGTLIGTRLRDGKEMRFETFLEELIACETPEVVGQVVQETRESYLRAVKGLLDRIHKPKILLWLSNRSPDLADDLTSPWTVLGEFPQLVNREMLDAMKAQCDAYVECASTKGIPQLLWPGNQPIEGTEVRGGMLINRYYPSPQMHEEAAARLLPKCERFLPGRFHTGSASARPVEPSEHTPFVIIGAERTGSNLLAGLLNSHDKVFTGGELFNPALIERGEILWELPLAGDVDELNAVRADDPVAFLSRMFATATETAHRAIGFKLMYHHADINEPLRDHLAADARIRVIHLKRRNLLRRFLSDTRARLTNVWAVGTGPIDISQPQVHLDFEDCLRDFAHVEAQERAYDVLFSKHEMLEVFYEDLAVDPQAIGARALRFLGLQANSELAIRHTKTGIDPLREAIDNYKELKSRMHQWASFFDE